MTVINTRINMKLDLHKAAVDKINQIIYTYMHKFKVDSIHFNYPIDGFTYYNVFPHYDSLRFESGWNSCNIKASTLIKVIKCLEKRDFHTFIKTNNHQLIKIKPKKND